MRRATAVIIGAGPGGLTTAYELLVNTDIQPIVLEATDDVGGISRTVNRDGNRMDLGGHRFFSKSERVMRWWLDVLPLQRFAVDRDSRALIGDAWGDPQNGPDPEDADEVMLVRSRSSRILHDGKLFDYPLTLSADTVRKLGLVNTARYGASYARAMLHPIRPERSLEDFLINRFGHSLYQRFFREYTEKVWGVPCNEIPAEWGAQRIKGVSIRKVLAHALRKALSTSGDLAQTGTETSLIERFLYPKYGPGQLWQTVAHRVQALGGDLRLNHRVTGLQHRDGRIRSVTVVDGSGCSERIDADFVVSTMPVRELIAGLAPEPPADVRRVAAGLQYRDFMTAGLLVDRIELAGGTVARDLGAKVPDNWIYIQEPGVRVGRMQIFNNWSPYMVADRDRISIGLEYFCCVGDPLWQLDDERFLDLAVDEMDKLGLVRRHRVLHRFAARMPKAYPAYFGTYGEFARIRAWIDGLSNLFLIGRNGMHRYNNQDHSMLTAMLAVEAMADGRTDKAVIWSVNTETDYHEERTDEKPALPRKPEVRSARLSGVADR